MNDAQLLTKPFAEWSPYMRAAYLEGWQNGKGLGGAKRESVTRDTGARSNGAAVVASAAWILGNEEAQEQREA